MDIERMLEVVTPILETYAYKAEARGQRIEIRDNKGRIAGSIGQDGRVTQKYEGKRNMMGALVRNKLVDAIESASAGEADNASTST